MMKRLKIERFYWDSENSTGYSDQKLCLTSDLSA